MDGVATPAGLSPCLAHCRPADITDSVGQSHDDKNQSPAAPTLFPAFPSTFSFVLESFVLFLLQKKPLSRVFPRETTTLRCSRTTFEGRKERMEKRFLVFPRISRANRSRSILARGKDKRDLDRRPTLKISFTRASARGEVASRRLRGIRNDVPTYAIVAWLARTENIRGRWIEKTDCASLSLSLSPAQV